MKPIDWFGPTDHGPSLRGLLIFMLLVACGTSIVEVWVGWDGLSRARATPVATSTSSFLYDSQMVFNVPSPRASRMVLDVPDYNGVPSPYDWPHQDYSFRVSGDELVVMRAASRTVSVTTAGRAAGWSCR